jgi:predicted dehydrogenase
MLQTVVTRTCTAIGTTGNLQWNGIANTVALSAANGDPTLLFDGLDCPDPYRTQLTEFLDSHERRTPPVVSGDDALGVLQIVEALRKAAATGQSVKLP